MASTDVLNDVSGDHLQLIISHPMIRHNLSLRIPFDSLKQKVIRINISKLEDEMFQTWL